jgi:hypothetical protein
MKNKAKWTFAVYMAGDNNLSNAGERDLAEMRRVGSSPDVNVVVEFDRSGANRETIRYQIQKKGLNERTESLGETDCGDPKVLLRFISWVAREFPAEHYALILWNHGGGWEPSEMDRIAKKVKAVGYGKAEGSQRSHSSLGRSMFRSTLKEILGRPNVSERAICSDDGTGHSLDTVELGNVLAEAADILKSPIDLLGMDACLMSNLEVAYQAQPFVNYAVASEESEPNDGWPYDSVLDPLVRNPEMTPAELACLIVEAYTRYYATLSNTWPVSQTALDLARIDQLVVPLDRLADLLKNAMPSAQREVNFAQYDCSPFWDGTLFDIAEFSVRLGSNFTDPALLQAAQEVRQSLQPGTGRLVMKEASFGPKLDKCAGLSIYLPERRRQMRISPYYSDVAFAKKHHWLAMLEAYHA